MCGCCSYRNAIANYSIVGDLCEKCIEHHHNPGDRMIRYPWGPGGIYSTVRESKVSISINGIVTMHIIT